VAVPYRKTAELSSLGENEIVGLEFVTHAQALLAQPRGHKVFNVGLNLGESAGGE